MSNRDTVQQIYEAFGQGDVPAILERLAPDVAWEDFEDNSGQNAGVPWLARRDGRDAVAGFFQSVGGGDLAVTGFEVRSIIGDGEKVVAECVIDATVVATGRSFRDEDAHVWTFDDAGQVTAFRHYVDTGKHLAAYKG